MPEKVRDARSHMYAVFYLCDSFYSTPGHVDFSYEVSRSLAACEGALLVVDASQGIEAQTLANVYLALENDLEIIPVLNKIDLPAADPERVAQEIEETIGLDCSEIVHASAKSGIGINDILESIVQLVPPPKAELDKPFRALIFDSVYDSYRGVIVFFRVMDGQVNKGDKIRFMNSAAEHEVTEVGVMTPQQVEVDELRAGEVGYICGGIKDVLDARVGDTMVLSKDYKAGMAAEDPIESLPGYSECIPVSIPCDCCMFSPIHVNNATIFAIFLTLLIFYSCKIDGIRWTFPSRC